MRRWRARRHAQQAVLDLSAYFAPILDQLAHAYESDPVGVGRLLRQHSSAVLTADLAVLSPYASDVHLMIARAEVEGTRAALLSQAPAADRLRLGLTRRACLELADDLTARAAALYLTTPEGNR